MQPDILIMMKVLKFGGTSLGNADRMRDVAAIIGREENCMVVCSAMSGVTDQLVALASAWKEGRQPDVDVLTAALQQRFQQTIPELMPSVAARQSALAILDEHFLRIRQQLLNGFCPELEGWLLARGELITTELFCLYLNHAGLDFRWLNALDFVSLNAQGEPEVESIRSSIFSLPRFTGRGRYLTQGFICRDQGGHVSNLQRGGSDYTATLLGAALKASVIEIWTDINGMHQNDPRMVENTRQITELSFSEAAELAYFGAKILHPACVWPASMLNIPIRLKNTMEPSAAGTLIRQGAMAAGIRAVAAKDGISMIRIRSARMLNAYGFLRRIFEIFENFRTPIDVITTSEVAVSLTIDNPLQLQPIVAELARLGTVEVETSQSIVCVVGDVLALHQAWAARILDALQHLPVNMVSLGGSRNNLTLVLPAQHKKEALNLLQQALFVQNTIVPAREERK